MGTATGTMNFFRSLGGAIIVAGFGAIVMGSLPADRAATVTMDTLAPALAAGVRHLEEHLGERPDTVRGLFSLAWQAIRTGWLSGLASAAVLGLLSGVQRWRAGRVAGSVAQVAVLAGGFWVPMMFAIGGLFVVLWFAMLRLGARIDRERAVFDAAHPDAVEPPRPRRH